MNKDSKKILILAAHPDDEVLGCGGVIQRYKESKNEIYVCIVTDGSSTQYSGNKKIARQKDVECEKANKLLGVKRVFRLNFPDMKLDTIPHFEVNNKINEIVEKIKPNVIYTHSSLDVNKDHYFVNQSTQVVVRPGKSYLVKVYEYEVFSSTEWARDKAFIPNTFVNIEKYIDKKIEGFKKYRTEVRKYPHPRSPEGIKSLAKYRGLQSGYKYAEAFRLVIEYK